MSKENLDNENINFIKKDTLLHLTYEDSKNIIKYIKKSFKKKIEENIFPINYKQFKCKYSGCDKQYLTKSRMQIHYRTHVNFFEIFYLI